MRFKYVACTPNGDVLTGVVEAESEAQAEEILWRRELTIISLRRELSLPSLDKAFPTVFGVKHSDLIALTRELANLLNSGIPLLHAIAIINEQARKPALKRVLREIMTELQTGNSFSQALSKYPQVFPDFFVRLTQVGESIGNMGLVLKQINAYLEKEAALRARVSKAVVYPMFVLLLSVFAVIVLFNLVLPAMMNLMKEFGGELPLTTKLLLAITDFIKEHGTKLFIGLIAVVLGGVLYSRTPRGIRMKDWLLFHFPVIKEIALASNLAATARTLSLLSGAGVNITETLDMAIKTTGNFTFKKILTGVKNDVLEGRLLSQAFSRHSLIPSLFREMIRVGEETGELQNNLQYLTTIYEDILNQNLSRLMSFIEPALILFVGSIVGLIAISVITPLYNLIGQVQ